MKGLLASKVANPKIVFALDKTYASPSDVVIDIPILVADRAIAQHEFSVFQSFIGDEIEHHSLAVAA